MPNMPSNDFKSPKIENNIHFPLTTIHPMARIWLYESVCEHFLATQTSTPTANQLDPQLLLEIYFDDMVFVYEAKKNEVNNLMGFDFLSFLLFCQSKAQHGFWLDEMLIDLIPQNEFNVLENKRQKEEIIISLLKCKTIAKNTVLNPPPKKRFGFIRDKFVGSLKFLFKTK